MDRHRQTENRRKNIRLKDKTIGKQKNTKAGKESRKIQTNITRKEIVNQQIHGFRHLQHSGWETK